MYRLEQQVPTTSTAETINVSYDEIASVLEANHSFYEWLGAILMVIAVVFSVAAKLADMWNRHRHEFPT